MIGKDYWSAGITVRYAYAGGGRMGWCAELSYLDGGFCDDSPERGIVSTEGVLRTRYVIPASEAADVLTVAIDALKADAERLGITWRDPSVYYKYDGEDEDGPPPDGWRELLGSQADRLGWRRLYAAAGDVT